jgi:hypothetical protein
LSACPLNLYKGISEVKVIDFLLPIKIGLPRISLLSHKLFFSAPRSSVAAGTAKWTHHGLEVDDTEALTRAFETFLGGIGTKSLANRSGAN